MAKKGSAGVLVEDKGCRVRGPRAIGGDSGGPGLEKLVQGVSVPGFGCRGVGPNAQE